MNVFDYDMIPSTSNDYIWCVYAWIAKCPDNEDAKLNTMMKPMSSCQISKLYYQNARIEHPCNICTITVGAAEQSSYNKHE